MIAFTATNRIVCVHARAAGCHRDGWGNALRPPSKRQS